MNEFVIWDKEKNIFVPQGEIIFSFYRDTRITVTPNCIEYIGDKCHNDYDENRFKIFKDIGLKDINGKSIYADSSVVEFEYSVGLWEYKKAIGVFSWDNINLKYRLNIIEKNNTYGKVIWNFDSKENKNFKIIDTVQENKLGLIK